MAVLAIVESSQKLAVIRHVSVYDYAFLFKSIDNNGLAEESIIVSRDSDSTFHDTVAYIKEHYREVPAPDIVSDGVKCYERIEDER